MNEKFTLSKSALIKILISAYPNPEEDTPHRPHFGPHDPIGPISRVGQVVKGPQPDPWKGAYIARVMIEQTVSRLRSAESIMGQEGMEQGQNSIFSALMEEVDDICGSVPYRFPWWWWFILHPIPIPDPGPDPPIVPVDRVNPLVLLMAGVEFSRAAETIREGELQKALTSAADRLFDAGLNRLGTG